LLGVPSLKQFHAVEVVCVGRCKYKNVPNGVRVEPVIKLAREEPLRDLGDVEHKANSVQNKHGKQQVEALFKSRDISPQVVPELVQLRDVIGVDSWHEPTACGANEEQHTEGVEPMSMEEAEERAKHAQQPKEGDGTQVEGLVGREAVKEVVDRRVEGEQDQT